MKKKRILQPAVALPTVILAALLGGCVGTGEATLSPEDAAATLDAERLPTLEAHMTAYAAQFGGSVTPVDPALLATLSTPMATANIQYETPEATIPATAAPTSGTGGAPTARPATAAPPAAVDNSAVVSGAFDGGDGYRTTVQQTINAGQTMSGRLATDIEGHNYVYTGRSGQKIEVVIASDGVSDLRAKLIDPAGTKLAQADGGDVGSTERLTYTLPADGSYTIRIDAWTPGGYTITLTVTG